MKSLINKHKKNNRNIVSKTLFLTLALIFSSFIGFSQDGITITVNIDNVPNNEGVVGMALHNQNTFMKTAPVKAKTSKIENNKVVITFKNIAPGEYAILANHDANNNGKMDFKENGMPLESYGASNNVMNFGPPQFSDSKFTVLDKDLELNIRF
ncbi:MAG: DUF2141 domain-containing protein [Winogradskyella sp.]|uniref:DUF2141 domain-containing protein n=1 Tax=Winogradskyella sp. TaxID=1883156 RepID=UPI0017F2613F|nr:DUF2141 domain-containing protein [Winogradskyella sp.]MBT8244883.1 DUF2141 domain-containing protein [Winogradskyella sp.]NNK21841.1 DUF2141 domain-containing protein [Winogradskyella sp.]